MKRLRKSNRVTWASGLNLCQVREFLAEDCPSKVGAQRHDYLQRNTSQMLDHLNAKEFNDFPPGFEGGQYLNQAKDVYITRIGWKCPPGVVMACEWRVAAGEESHEAEIQNFREMRMLEAVFPHPAAIPPSPSVSLGIEEECYDDSLTPVIPLKPIEEAPTYMSSESSPAVPQDPISTCNTPVQQLASKIPKLGTLPDLGADIILAASAAVDVLKKSMDGSSIDTDLLVKIFSDPKMIENLMKDGLAPAVTTSVPRSFPPPCPITKPASPAPAPAPAPAVRPCQPILKPELRYSLPMPVHGDLYPTNTEVQPANSRMPPQLDTVSVSLPMLETMGTNVSDMPTRPIDGAKLSVESKPTLVPPSSGMMHFQISSPMVTIKPNPVTDMNYFKNLIREHGTEKKELLNANTNCNGPHFKHIQNLEYAQNVERKEVRSKFQKACMYFRGPKGCRNGSNCPYKHDSSFKFHNSGPLDIPVAKRMKYFGEITTGTCK